MRIYAAIITVMLLFIFSATLDGLHVATHPAHFWLMGFFTSIIGMFIFLWDKL